MSRNKRVTAMALAILAFFIFIGSPFQVPAKALVVDASIICIIIAALAAMGITITAAGSFGDVTEYVEGLLQEYAQSRGLTVNQLFDGVQTGSNKLGDILLNNRFVILIDTFSKWIVTKFGLTDNDTKSLVTPGASIDGLTLYRLPIVLKSTDGRVPDKGITVITSEDLVYVGFGIDGNQLLANCISDGPATLSFADIRGDTWTETNQRELSYNDAYEKYSYTNSYVRGYFDTAPLSVYPQADLVAALSQNVTSTEKQIDVSTGIIGIIRIIGRIRYNSGAVLDVGGSWGETYDDLTDYQIPVGYEDATIEYQGEADVADQIEDTPAQSISQNVSDYQVGGLPGVFPFCIPFDIYNFFECLAAEPVAPHFVWRFYVPGICDESIDLDLAQFDTVAQIVRTMELLAFIVGLAVVTRNRFLRG